MNNTFSPVIVACIHSTWDILSWFMTFYVPPIIVVYIAYRFGIKTFINEKKHDRKALLTAREHDFIKKRYIVEGLDKISSSLNWYLAHYNSNHSIAGEVIARCTTQRISNKDNLEDLSFKPIETIHDLSPFLRINNLAGDNIYHLLMQLVQARTETYYYSRCSDILDLGKYLLEHRSSLPEKEFKDHLAKLDELKESETNIFYRFHSIPYSLLRITDALEKSLIQNEPISGFGENKILIEEIQNMENVFSNELNQYANNRVRGNLLNYAP